MSNIEVGCLSVTILKDAGDDLPHDTPAKEVEHLHLNWHIGPLADVKEGQLDLVVVESDDDRNTVLSNLSTTGSYGNSELEVVLEPELGPIQGEAILVIQVEHILQACHLASVSCPGTEAVSCDTHISGWGEEWICHDLVPAYTVVSMLSITTAVMGEVKETESSICPVWMVYTLTVMSKLLVMTLAPCAGPCPTLTPVTGRA